MHTLSKLSIIFILSSSMSAHATIDFTFDIPDTASWSSSDYAEPFKAGDSLTVSFNDSTDLTMLNNSDLESWTWFVSGESYFSDRLDFSSMTNFIDEYFQYDSGILSLVVGGPTISDNVITSYDSNYFRAQLGKGNKTSLLLDILPDNSEDSRYNAWNDIDSLTLINNPSINVPEPSAFALMGLGLLGFVATRRKLQS